MRRAPRCSDPNDHSLHEHRLAIEGGPDELSLRIVVRRLAEAPKDRSPDHLSCAAHDHPTLEEDRREGGYGATIWVETARQSG